MDLKNHLYCAEEFVNLIILKLCLVLMIHASVVVLESKDFILVIQVMVWVVDFSSFLFVLEKKEGKTFWS